MNERFSQDLRRWRASILAAAALALTACATAPGDDKAQASAPPPSPLLPSIPGATTAGYYHTNFDLAYMPIGPIEDRIAAGENTLALQGALSQRIYRLPDNMPQYQAYVRYRNLLENAGFEILFTCMGENACGADFGHYVNDRAPVVKRRLNYTAYTPYAAIAARRASPGKQTYAFIYAGKYDPHRVFEQAVVAADTKSSNAEHPLQQKHSS